MRDILWLSLCNKNYAANKLPQHIMPTGTYKNLTTNIPEHESTRGLLILKREICLDKVQHKEQKSGIYHFQSSKGCLPLGVN
ncbi:hypothetical protein DNK09_09360 [Escherichia coli]|nr:hypothetical protein AM344_20185 [Escherichia coli]EEY6055062.1 hypothetical protein [Escherichia coli]EFE7282576.1 hypothetical protein [Escherichia coli]EFF9805202.1 hypothetical protein [Escherichia coli]EFN3792676.1 hypothetical protein [Escherichia coli]